MLQLNMKNRFNSLPIISFRLKKPILLSLFFIFLFAIISIIIPYLLLIWGLFSASLIFISHFQTITNNLFKNDILFVFITLLKNIGFLRYCLIIHTYIFITSSNLIFTLILLSTNTLHLLYSLITRYIIYITIFSPLILSTHLYILYTIGLFLTSLGLFAKIIINFINFICITCYNKYPYLVLVDPVEVPSQGTRMPTNSISLLSLHNHHHNHRSPVPRISTWGKVGIFCAAGTVCIGFGALYLAKEQLLATQQQAITAQQQATTAQQGVDLNEVTLGIRSRESYEKKWPDSSRK
jgi:hypothetical protein